MTDFTLNLVIFLCLGIHKAQAQLGVAISGNSSLQYGVDDLEITCFPQGSFTQIISYTLWKTNGSSELQRIVTQEYSIPAVTVLTTWIDQSVQSRANLSGTPLPFGSATMVLKIPRDSITCPDDIAGYVCEFGGALSNNPGETPETRSPQLNVNVLNDPAHIEPIQVSASVDGSDVIAMDNNGTYVFMEGTELRVICNATVGNPTQPMRWCSQRMNESGWEVVLNVTSQITPKYDQCQNVMTSYLSYVVSPAYVTTRLMCEVGGSGECGTGVLNDSIVIRSAHLKKKFVKGGTRLRSIFPLLDPPREDLAEKQQYLYGTLGTSFLPSFIKIPRVVLKKK